MCDVSATIRHGIFIIDILAQGDTEKAYLYSLDFPTVRLLCLEANGHGRLILMCSELSPETKQQPHG